jgi:hypothetical protein
VNSGTPTLRRRPRLPHPLLRQLHRGAIRLNFGPIPGSAETSWCDASGSRFAKGH